MTELLAHSLGLDDPAFLIQEKMPYCWHKLSDHLAVAVICCQLSFFSSVDIVNMATFDQHIAQPSQVFQS